MFLHFFPARWSRFGQHRRKGSSLYDGFDRQAQETAALTTLESVARFGLLLSEENLEVQVPIYPIDSEQKPFLRNLALRQFRASFCKLDSVTALQRRVSIANSSEGNTTPLSVTHCDVFGDFWIAISRAGGKRIGLQPVYYFDRPEYHPVIENKLPRAEDLSITTLLALIDTLRILTPLLVLEKVAQGIEWSKAHGADDFVHPFQPFLASGFVEKVTSEDVGFTKSILDMPRTEAVKTLMSLLPFKHMDLESMISQIELLIGRMQTVSSRTLFSDFLYYWQNEWRLLNQDVTDLALVPIGQFCEDPTLEVTRKELVHFLSSNRVYRNENSLVLLGIKETSGAFYPFRDLIVEIGCPKESEDSVVRIIDRYRLNAVVSLH